MRSITCPCDAVFEADLPEQVDLDATPGILSEIMNGTFMSARCPECGNLVKPDLPVRVLAPSRGVNLQVVPELERWTFYRGAVPVEPGAEVVIGFRELVERIQARVDELSPKALELIKYYLLARAEQENPEAEIVIEYAGKENGHLVFDIWGLKEDEAGILRVPVEMYEKTLSDLERKSSEEPFSRIFSGPYSSIRILEADIGED